MTVYISPAGNPEEWEQKPDGHYTWEEWRAAHQQPTPTLQEARADKLATLAAFRYEKESGGIVVGGHTILTDARTQAMLTSAIGITEMQPDPDIVIDWKAQDGWVQLNIDALQTVALAVAAHVQSCFSVEKAHSDVINTLTTIAGITAYDITTGWPTNA